ncbi:CAAX prenyl protease 2 isoform X1 [Ceratina calcarata]|uniref:CAAX prenyl protease 2 n=2 Tax=Ceratina calcarata TaxID=156304 RepID=A0AAJ7NEB1_9HYME|nr:CAAX prenyl protease 2 isoform X1 [Ceratina calcarata]
MNFCCSPSRPSPAALLPSYAIFLSRVLSLTLPIPSSAMDRDTSNQHQYGVMETVDRNTDFSCTTTAILSCFVLSVMYVASLYVWGLPYNSNHPTVIKQRFFSVFIMSLISPAFVYFRINDKTFQKATMWELLGLRWPGLFQAIVIPLLLTMILFLGPICMQGFNGFFRLYAVPMYWLGNMRTIIWWRNVVVAPLAEEWTFRACMLPLLLQCFTPTTAIFTCPLFFGFAHFHHLVDRMRTGMNLKHAILLSCFQCAFTTLFGAYAVFLFIKTGHFAAVFVVHSFCNCMGCPDLSEVVAVKDRLKRVGLLSLFIIGLVAWCFLLTPMTNPRLFQ